MASQNKTNLSSLESQLEKEVKQIRVKNSNTVKEIALKVLDVATSLTVIDTSKAVSNWQVSLDYPQLDGLEAHVKGKGGSTGQESIRHTKSDAIEAIKDKKIGQSIFIINNAELVPEWSGSDAYVARANLVEAESEAYTEGLTLAAVAESLVGDK